MAVLASNQIPADAYADFKRLAVRMDQKCAEWLALLADDVDADQVWAWYREMYWAWTRLNEIAAVPGIVEYALEQEADPTYDVVAEFGAMMTLLQSAYVWLYVAIPRDANGYTLTHTTTQLGERVPRVFTPAETAPFLPYLNAIAQAIV